MKVMVSKTMAKFIAKELKPEKISVDYMEISQDDFRFCVDSCYMDHLADWDFDKQVFKVIRLVYPPECYAMPQFITTKALDHFFKKSDRTAAGFVQVMKDYVLI